MARGDGARMAWEEPFFTALREGKSVAAAARAGGIAPNTARKRRRANAAFAARWEEALARAARDTGRVPARSPHWKIAFLETLAQTSNVSASAAAANTPLATAYRVRRDDPAFALKWRGALHEGYEHLEMEVLAYLRGTMADRKIDVASAIRLLAAHRQTIAEIRAGQDERSEEEIIASINDLIDRMRREDGDLPPEPTDG